MGRQCVGNIERIAQLIVMIRQRDNPWKQTAGFGLGVALARRTPTATLRILIGGMCCLLGLVLLVRGFSG